MRLYPFRSLKPTNSPQSTAANATQHVSDDRPKRARHPHLPPLFYKTQSRSWDDVVRRSRTHPFEVLVQEDISGNTPLHIACRLDPPAEVIRALAAARGERNAEGATPLHVAASSRCSGEVISALINSQPATSETSGAETGEDLAANNKHLPSQSATAALTRMGRSPLHYACMSFRGLGVDAFRVLLEATIESGFVDQGQDYYNDEDSLLLGDEEDEEITGACVGAVNVATLRDNTGQTPLGLLFRRYRERVRCVIKMVENANLNPSSSGGMPPTAATAAAEAVQADLGELWEKARLIVGLMAEQRLRREEEEDNNLLVGSRRQVMGYLHGVPPAEAMAAMEAAAWASRSHRSKVSSGPDGAEESEARPGGHTLGPRRFRIVHASVGLTGYGCPPEMIRLAISVHPEQVREMDEDGNLPIHIAAVASSHTAVSSENAGALTEPAVPLVPGAPQAADNDDSSTISDFSSFSSFSGSQPLCSPQAAFDKVIKVLLRHYPSSAQVPHGRTGRLPFILAVDAGRRGWGDGLRTLLNAYPPALESREMNVRLFPCILALVGNGAAADEAAALGRGKGAFGGKGRRTCSWGGRGALRARSKGFNTLFELVRAKPNIVGDSFAA